MDIQFHAVSALVDGQPERGKGVLGPVRGSAAVGDDEGQDSSSPRWAALPDVEHALGW
jgi:hypothetical protein